MARLTGLQKAIERTDLARVKRILTQSPTTSLDRPLEGGYPPLVVAATAGSAEMIRLLVESGAGPQQRCRPFQDTALHFAATPAAVEALLSAGAEIEAASEEESRPLHAAVASNLPAVVAALLSRGADPNVHCRPYGDSPLHLAVRELRVKLIEILLRRGADPNVRDDEGATPLHLAALLRTKRVLPIVHALLQGGAKVDAANSAGITPLMAAAMNGELAVLRALIEAGASLDAIDAWSQTALSHAVCQGRRDAAKLLVDAHANPDIRISEKHPHAARRGATARDLAEASSDRGIRSLFKP